jgi:AcrR family transcriptional regulator
VAATSRVDGRRERSRRTRARIVHAAAQLFVENGYVATTIEAIAERAEVANQTVYYVFGTKAGVLTAVLEGSIVGDLDPVALADRQWVETLADVEDAAAAVDRLVAESVQVLVRVAPIYRVLQHAAADPDVGGLLEETRRRRRLDQRRLIDVGVAQRGLRPGLDADTAADVYYALINEDVFESLTVDCGWEVEQFQQWATALLQQQLLGVHT